MIPTISTRSLGATLLVAVAVSVLIAPRLHAEDEPFRPEKFERERSAHVNGDPDEVYALLSPEKRHLWTGKKDTRECVFDGFGKTQSGAMYYSVDQHHGYRWEVMAEDNPEERLMRWILIMPEVELLVAEIRCNPSEGGTELNMAWSVIGISPDGNQAVKEFFDTDAFEEQVDKTAEKLNEYLAS